MYMYIVKVHVCADNNWAVFFLETPALSVCSIILLLFACLLDLLLYGPAND